ncbi:hypothetical protein ACIQVK_19610 [Streptomyces sp. NPDC090493]|uniref:hypothetical protein n=1 Tax=Streptomyces sp. NPDC090493 TaxID=3365964 RepID=UPI0037F3177E
MLATAERAHPVGALGAEEMVWHVPADPGSWNGDCVAHRIFCDDGPGIGVSGGTQDAPEDLTGRAAPVPSASNSTCATAAPEPPTDHCSAARHLPGCHHQEAPAVIQPDQTYRSCQPVHSEPEPRRTRIKVVGQPGRIPGVWGFGKVDVVTLADDGRELRRRAIRMDQLHETATTYDGKPRRTGYVRETP